MAKRNSFDCSIHAVVPREIFDAADQAAGSSMVSLSAYVRGALQRDLVAKGFLSAPPIPRIPPLYSSPAALGEPA